MVTFTTFAIILATLVVSIALGFFQANYFIGLGLLLVVISSCIGMFITYRNARKAKAAALVTLDDYLPPDNYSESHTFKFTSQLGGIDTRNPIPGILKQIEELQKHSISDEKNAFKRHMTNSARIDICLANLRFHEEVTLARIMGQGAGVVMLSIGLTLWGSIYLAFPNEIYSAFKQIADFLRAVVGR